jgi:hypothetical protein
MFLVSRDIAKGLDSAFKVVARTHLVSPIMALVTAVAGRFVDVRQWG